MLVQAGLESQDAGRDRRRVRGGLPRRRGAGQHPAGPRLPAGDRAHRRRCSRWPSALEDAGHAYATAERQRLLLGRGVRRLRAAVGQHARRPAGRPSRRGRAGQARPGRLRALEGGRRRAGSLQMADRRAGARASRAGTSSARRWRCATSATAFDIHTGGIDNVFPHHEDEIAQSAPIVGGVPARHLGPRRVPADGGPEDGQVGRQLPARHRARRARASTRWRSATSC